MISEVTFANMGAPLVMASEKMTLNALSAVRSFAIRASINPTALTAFEREILARIEKDLRVFGRDIRRFSDEQIAEAYIRGVRDAKTTASRLGQPTDTRAPIPGRQVFAPVPVNATASAVQQLTTAGLSAHAGYVGAFQQAVINDGATMQMMILRETRDVLRNIQIEASRAQFLEADTLTRRGFTQGILDRIATDGIPAVRYADGRMVSVEAYSEMVARTTLGNCARQGGLNRSAEMGNDLVRMSTHARSSPMCEPWEGGVYSQSGSSDKYPDLQTAIDEGAFHPNCKHSLNPYYEGISPELQPDGTPEENLLGNSVTYEAEQQQRYYERGIRQWKRREAVALTPEQAERAKSKVAEWQGKQREHLTENPYLRRQYQREQI